MIKIIRAENGYIIKDTAFDSSWVIPIQDDKKGIKDLLHTILDVLGENGSKYDSERIHIVTLPGDNYEGPQTESVKESLEFLKYYFISEDDETA